MKNVSNKFCGECAKVYVYQISSNLVHPCGRKKNKTKIRHIFLPKKCVLGPKVPQNSHKLNNVSNKSCEECAKVYMYQISSHLVDPCGRNTKNWFFEISKAGQNQFFRFFSLQRLKMTLTKKTQKNPIYERIFCLLLL